MILKSLGVEIVRTPDGAVPSAPESIFGVAKR